MKRLDFCSIIQLNDAYVFEIRERKKYKSEVNCVLRRFIH